MSRPWLLKWREAVLSDAGPADPTTRAVLLVLSTDADSDGGSCFPSTRRLASRSRRTRKTVETHLRAAETEGWIERDQSGDGQGWRRTRYTFRIPSGLGATATPGPDGDVESELRHVRGQRGVVATPASGGDVESPLPHVDAERGVIDARRGVIDDPNVEYPLPTTTIETSPDTSLSCDESHQAEKGFPSLSRLPREGVARIYPAEFEGGFSALPARHRSHPKGAAYSAWRARVQEGAEPFRLEAAADAYREEQEALGNVGTEFVAMGATFFGLGGRWETYLGVEPGSFRPAAPARADDRTQRRGSRPERSGPDIDLGSFTEGLNRARGQG